MNPCSLLFFALSAISFLIDSATTQSPIDPSCTETDGGSLTYVVDVSGSMGDDMVGLKLGNHQLLNWLTDFFPCGVREYTMVEFNDPGVGPVRKTTSRNQFEDFFQNLVVSGGGDCPELYFAGLKLALQNSPPRSIIVTLTDASAKDYSNTALVTEVYNLISTTESEVITVATGLCGTESDLDYLAYREVSARSFGHVFQVTVPEINVVFNLLSYKMSIPKYLRKRLRSKDFESGTNSDSFAITEEFNSLVLSTDGRVTALEITGPAGSVVHIEKKFDERWGSMSEIRKPPKGTWTIKIVSSSKCSYRIEAADVSDSSATSDCSKCHADATCEDYRGKFHCICKDGFFGNGFRCSDVDECAYSWLNKCGDYPCVNTHGSHTCTCPRGYSYDHRARACVDIDECSKRELHSCGILRKCSNTLGSYTCVCPLGMKWNGFSCALICIPPKCDLDTALCLCAENEECAIVDKKQACICKKEFRVSDISEIKPILTCGATEMTATFLKCQLRSQNIDVSNIKIVDEGCYRRQDTPGNYSFSIPHKDVKCRGLIELTSESTTYIKKVQFTLVSSDGSIKPREITFEMKCSYPIIWESARNS